MNAITMSNNLAYIDADECINCGMCVVKCPQNTIEDAEKMFMVKK